MNRTVKPSVLNGTIAIPASKSMAHRSLICAALSDCPTQIICSTVSQDIEATANALCTLGATIQRTESGFSVTPIRKRNSEAILNCIESGSTLRFLLPIASALGQTAHFVGQGRLPQRPIQPLVDNLTAHGVTFSADRLPFTVSGQLHGGDFALNGDVSSQFFSGLLFALPLLDEKSTVSFQTPAQSLPYVQMTLQVLSAFGIDLAFDGTTADILPACRYRSPERYTVEGDWSNAAFFLCSAAIDGQITATGLSTNSPQGDRKLSDILQSFGANVTTDDGSITVQSNDHKPLAVNCSDNPDLVPMLAVMSCFACGTSRFYQAERLRMKESDRLQATVELIRALGGQAEANGSTLFVHGNGKLCGGTADGK
ncbi:MAG TPA: 3-phosphoshikimate 1-carboxyvinyltransferase, partial [Ruminococcaceae bacterium]|nr:3-phosphoshikimate 1-carboxyvinyltransferase [Oscillospiraceae bacterium]